MSEYIVSKLMRTLIKKRVEISNLKILILVLLSKKIKDVRNSKVFDIKRIKSTNISQDIFDPYVDPNEIEI